MYKQNLLKIKKNILFITLFFVIMLIILSFKANGVDVFFGGAYTTELTIDISKEKNNINITWVNLIQYEDATLQYGIFATVNNDLYDEENETGNSNWKSYISVVDENYNIMLPSTELVNDTLTEPFDAVEGKQYHVKVNIIVPETNGEYTLRFLVVATPYEHGEGSGAYISDSEATKHFVTIKGAGYVEKSSEGIALEYILIFIGIIAIVIILSVFLVHRKKTKKVEKVKAKKPKRNLKAEYTIKKIVVELFGDRLPTKTRLKSMKKDELIIAAKKINLQSDGTKNELIDRILDRITKYYQEGRK